MTTVLRSCPECDFSNSPKATVCGSCSTPLVGTGKKSKEPTYDDRCAFSWGQGRRCRMPVEGWPGQTPQIVNGRYQGWCGWHDEVRRLPRVVDDRDAFEQWWAGWYGATVAYCTVWTHYPLEHLWTLTLGDNPGFRLGDPCRLGACPHRSVEPYAGPWPPTWVMWAELQNELEQIGG